MRYCGVLHYSIDENLCWITATIDYEIVEMKWNEIVVESWIPGQSLCLGYVRNHGSSRFLSWRKLVGIEQIFFWYLLFLFLIIAFR